MVSSAAMPDHDDRMPLTLLGGFLGSGKSTWLRHQLHEAVWSGAHVLVNEAAEVPVDQVMLAAASQITILAGGCACCDGLEDLRAALCGLADRRLRDSARTTRPIILETSGLADPASIVAAIRADPVLVHHVAVAEVIVTVDAVNGLSQLESEPLGRRQVEVADRLILTKVDGVAVSDVRRLAATLRTLNAHATIEAAILGRDVPVPDFADTAPAELASLDGAGPIRAIALRLGETVNWTVFCLWLSALLHARADQVLRVKGIVETPAGALLLQGVRHAMQQPEILPPTLFRPDNTVVLIGRGFDQALVEASLAAFTRRSP